MIIMVVIAVPIPAVMVVAVAIAMIIRIVNATAFANDTTRAGEKGDQAKQIHHQFHDITSSGLRG